MGPQPKHLGATYLDMLVRVCARRRPAACPACVAAGHARILGAAAAVRAPPPPPPCRPPALHPPARLQYSETCNGACDSRTCSICALPARSSQQRCKGAEKGGGRAFAIAVSARSVTVPTMSAHYMLLCFTTLFVRNLHKSRCVMLQWVWYPWYQGRVGVLHTMLT
jgi:hypothetical protein